MEPTIYKPSIYKGAGIYKVGAGGGGGGNFPHSNLVLLDYFEDSYRFGELPTGNFTNLQYDNLPGIVQNIFTNGVPNAFFNGANSDPLIIYNLNDKIDLSQGYTIEMYFHMDGYNNNNTYMEFCNIFSNQFDYRNITDHQSAWNANYRSVNNQILYDTSSHIQALVNNYEWLHYAVTRKGTRLVSFLNGVRLYDYDNMYDPIGHYKEASIQFPPCARNVNTNAKVRGYFITQLAVWNYPKYESDFTPSDKLIIDPNYT